MFPVSRLGGVAKTLFPDILPSLWSSCGRGQVVCACQRQVRAPTARSIAAPVFALHFPIPAAIAGL